MDVVLLCRVSTAGQDYSRQVDELSDFCSKMGWNVRRIFTAKVSGAKKIEERSELTEMLDYIRENRIDRVCVLEISRLGKNTLEALKVIRLLNDNGVCLYIKNYNLETLGADGKPNPIASMICTILLEVAQMERLTIMERMASGRDRYIAKCRAEGIKMGRPGTYRKSDERMRTQYTKELGLLKKGISLRNISAITGTSVGTIRKLYKYL
uniref:recombinase family protein n=1 Tax=Candidatus Cryptobacteroides bacterium TaxID=3085639 RepID=UPI00402855B3